MLYPPTKHLVAIPREAMRCHFLELDTLAHTIKQFPYPAVAVKCAGEGNLVFRPIIDPFDVRRKKRKGRIDVSQIESIEEALYDISASLGIARDREAPDDGKDLPCVVFVWWTSAI